MNSEEVSRKTSTSSAQDALISQRLHQSQEHTGKHSVKMRLD